MKRLYLLAAVVSVALCVGLAAQSAKPVPQATAPAKAAPATAAPAPAPAATTPPATTPAPQKGGKPSAPAPPIGGPKDWPTIGNDPGGMRLSPLTQITPENVTQLKEAWSYDMGAPSNGYQHTPVVINSVMYLPIQAGTIMVALRAESGKELWRTEFKSIPALPANSTVGQRRPLLLARYRHGAATRGCAHDQRVPGAARCEDRQARSRVRPA